MENKRELKETDIKNRTCYHFDDISQSITDRDIDFNDIFLVEKFYKVKTESISIYDILHKHSVGGKPWKQMV